MRAIAKTWWLVFIILGSMSGYLWWYVETAGYFVRWEKLKTPPAEAVELLASRGYIVYIRTSDNKILSCNNGYECWIPDFVPDENQRLYYKTTQKPCDLRGVEFTLVTRPPSKIGSCLRSEIQYAESTIEVTHVLDLYGNLWLWENVKSVFDQVVLPFHIGFGAVGGFGVLLIIILTRKLSHFIKRTRSPV